MKREGILVVLSGFAGTGKGSVVHGLMEQYEQYALSVSMTTRKPRPGEEEGVSYFFVDRERFEEEIKNDGLIEYASYCDNYYGTPKKYVQQQLKEGRDVILEIEIQGALKIKEQFPTALLLFIVPPSAAELKRRLVSRGTETPEVIEKRMRRAAEEAEGIDEYDYIIVNDSLEDCIRKTHEVINAARLTPVRNEAFIKGIQSELVEISQK
ncbi:MAG: guanylate kinase [Lachnospiraceae bacterium]|nr:guanylate kinase [Lachnospiraceae bacterium]